MFVLSAFTSNHSLSLYPFFSVVESTNWASNFGRTGSGRATWEEKLGDALGETWAAACGGTGGKAVEDTWGGTGLVAWRGTGGADWGKQGSGWVNICCFLHCTLRVNTKYY